MKITFFGDVMCELPVLQKAKQKDGSYDFHEIFTQVKPLLAESDYVVTNLETPLAGEEAGYSAHYFAFNAPDSYVDALMDSGVHLVSTSNNHTFDRGYEGMKRTIRVLDEKGLGHTGTWLPGQQREEAYYADVCGVKVAVIAYTYGTNIGGSGLGCEASGEYAGTVNLLRPQRGSVYLPGVVKKDWLDKLMKGIHLEEKKARVKKFLGMPHNTPRADDNLDKEKMAPYVAQFQNDIRKAKEKADLVLFYPHVGGQFNPKPGAISEYVVEKAIEAGADAVIASHSHIVQKAEWKNGVPCAFSLGNFSMSPISALMLQEFLPGIGLAMHLYVEDKRIVKVTFSLLKAVETKKEQLVSWPMDVLYANATTEAERKFLEKEAAQMVETVTGKKPDGPVIRREYEL